MTRRAVLAMLGLLGCEDAASGLPPTDTPPLIRAEDPPNTADRVYDCDLMTPVIAITRGQTLMDGSPVEDARLESALAARQELNRELGGKPLFELVIQVDAGVPERRVVRLLNRARDAGFFSVTRMNVELE